MTDGTDGEGDNLWSRLRRRKLVQWGFAYAAGAWGLLQGLAYVSSTLDWPAQSAKAHGLALLIGLPIVSSSPGSTATAVTAASPAPNSRS